MSLIRPMRWGEITDPEIELDSTNQLGKSALDTSASIQQFLGIVPLSSAQFHCAMGGRN